MAPSVGGLPCVVGTALSAEGTLNMHQPVCIPSTVGINKVQPFVLFCPYEHCAFEKQILK